MTMNDPVAQKTSQKPCMDGGSNVKTQEVVVADNVVKIQRTKSTETLLWIMIALGGLIVLFGVAGSWYLDTLVGGVFALLLGGFIGLFAYYSLKRSSPPTVFDEHQKIYYRGDLATARASNEPNNYGKFSDIYAIQLLNKEIRTSTNGGDDSITFTCYELNLVLNDGNRLNVMNHGVYDEVVKSSNTLSELLNIPIWQVG